MKKVSLIASMLLTSLLAFGCANLGAELIDALGEPENIYHSGKDLLSGDYLIMPKPDNKTDKPNPVTLRQDSKGWKITEGDSPAIHVYEATPEEMSKMFHRFDQNTMQCAEVASFKMCTAPKGTRMERDGKTLTFETGYLVMMGADWDNAVKK